MRNRGGVSFAEFLGFLAVLGIGAAVCIYMQKPKVVVRTVVVQPAPVEAAPAPVAAPVVAQPASEIEVPAATAAPMRELPETVAIVTPPAPACVAIEKKLRIAQQAAVEANREIAAAKVAAVKTWHQSSDYQAMKTDLDEKKRAKDAAIAGFQRDNSAGNDTDQDTRDIRATSAAWAKQLGDVTQLENEAVADDETVRRKTDDLRDIKSDIATQQRELGNYIDRQIRSVCNRTECAIGHVNIDVDSWVIGVDMSPAVQSSAGKMADEAMNNVGTILETLSKSPFTWQAIRFRVCDESEKTVEYQLSYERDAIIDTNFEAMHVNSLLYQPIHTTDLRVGKTGILFDVKIMNIVDEKNMIVWLDESNGNIDDLLRPVWIRGIDTTGKVDESNLDITTPLKVTGTIRYTTVAGEGKTVFLLEPTGFDENVVVGDYYNNSRLVATAQEVWLNQSIDQMQGRAALPDTYIRRAGTAAPEVVNTLQIGGYTRTDGTYCAAFFVHSPHLVRAAAPDPPKNNTAPLPFRSRTSPLIVNNPPGPGF